MFYIGLSRLNTFVDLISRAGHLMIAKAFLAHGGGSVRTIIKSLLLFTGGW
jgi:hypothetical protein